MTLPLISVREALVRAAMHFVAKGEAARAYPARAGVHFEPATVGVLIVAMDDDAMLVLRDPLGDASRAATVKIAQPFFKSARRTTSLGAARAILNIGGGEARLHGVAMDAPEIHLPYPNWRKLTPGRACGSPPAIEPADAERVGIVAGILSSIEEAAPRGVRYSGTTDRDKEVALASFNGWPDAYAVVSPVPESAAVAPWQRPIWSMPFSIPEVRAS